MRPSGILTILISTCCAAGCGQGGAPFTMAPVQGTVRYEDGPPIEAERIEIVFEPVERERVDGTAPAPARGEVNVADGTFRNLTTWNYGDGAIVGRHKVTLSSSRINERGIPQPTDAVPKQYRRASTTPLEVEVVRRGPNRFQLEVAKP